MQLFGFYQTTDAASCHGDHIPYVKFKNVLIKYLVACYQLLK